ncbi:Transient receptor potential cation channel subfamily M member 2 [Lamellibrachia satsuma]|nr:Transient receptor potential cation channel subfamily M member 2 [Lamellibrachia satsuma]
MVIVPSASLLLACGTVFPMRCENGSWPAEYKDDVDSEGKRHSSLDPNHSHFIFVDNGIQYQFGVEIELRAKLEAHISQNYRANDGDKIPTVCVVLQGGPGTLKTVHSSINAGTPVVIVEGSGRAADVLAHAYAAENASEQDSLRSSSYRAAGTAGSLDSESEHSLVLTATLITFCIFIDLPHGLSRWMMECALKIFVWHLLSLEPFPSPYNSVRHFAGRRRTVKGMIMKEFPNEKSEDQTNMVTYVTGCLEKRDYMSVFRMDSSDSAKEIDLVILQALLKVNKGGPGTGFEKQLKLALTWNRIDIAKNEILTEDANWQVSKLMHATDLFLLLAVTQSVDNLFHSLIVLCENEYFLISNLH